MIDLTYLKQVSGGDTVFINDILGMFINQTMPDIRALKSLAAIGDKTQLASAAHRCKSAISMLGNTRATELITSIEHEAKLNEEKNSISEHIAELEVLTIALEQEIHKLMK
ncbi:MAG: Hpt domain-containing protein [Bacteroidota bacterium]|jgi:HPt (histidine-containing phosphotransfer) domain-containing protein